MSDDSENVTALISQAGVATLEIIVNGFEPTPEVVGAVVGSYIKIGATAAVRWDMTEAEFMRIARAAFNHIRTLTREVDKEDN